MKWAIRSSTELCSALNLDINEVKLSVDGETQFPVFVPLAGPSVNQVALSVTVHESVPPPVFEVANVLDAGLAPPATPVNARLAGLTPMTGVVDATVKVTGTVFVIPPPVSVAFPV